MGEDHETLFLSLEFFHPFCYRTRERHKSIANWGVKGQGREEGGGDLEKANVAEFPGLLDLHTSLPRTP